MWLDCTFIITNGTSGKSLVWWISWSETAVKVLSLRVTHNHSAVLHRPFTVRMAAEFAPPQRGTGKQLSESYADSSNEFAPI